jgi:hypothetical protein
MNNNRTYTHTLAEEAACFIDMEEKDNFDEYVDI